MNASLWIVGGDVLDPSGSLRRAAVLIEGGVITAIGDEAERAPPEDAERVDADGLIVAPGLIDLQINGGFGYDFTQDPYSMWEVGARLPAHGVTGFLPTVVTSGAAARQAMLAVLAGGAPDGYRGASPLGVHFEGPFISAARSGAHEPGRLRSPEEPDPDVAGWSLEAGVRMVTLAPELQGALDLTRYLVQRGVVVSAGHSAATRDEAVAGFDAGITYATHLFNAMPPLGQREPGLAGAALADLRVTLGLIADGIHVHPDVIRIAASAGRNRISLVTDATAALGMAPGRYVLGGRDVVLDGNSVRLADDSRLAGSALTADEALRGFTAMSGWSHVDAIGTMTSVPARLLSLTDRGLVRVGCRADLTLFSQDHQVVATYVSGKRWG